MLPEPAVLRAAASTLSGVDDDAQRSDVMAQARAAHWRAPAADRIKLDLAGSDALARSGADELRAGAVHLRRLATAVEMLEESMRQERRRVAAQLQTDLSALAPERRAVDGRHLEGQLAGLPGPQDPYWATQVDVPAVPLPQLPTVRPVGLVEHGPFVGVSIDTAAVRGVALAAERMSQRAAQSRQVAARAVSCLPYAELDRYQLPGSAAQTFLSSVTGATSSLAGAASGFERDAGRSTALAEIVERADAAGAAQQELLGDPRAGQAVDLAAALAAGASSDDLWTAVGEPSAADLAWLMTVVPELEAALSEDADGGPPVTWLDAADWANGVVGVPGQAAERAATRAAETGAAAKAIKPIKGSTLEQRQTYRAAIREMKSARADAARMSAIAGRVPAGGLLDYVNRPVSAGAPVLRHVPVLSVGFTVGGTALDVHEGMSFEKAATKNVASTATGLAATAGMTVLLAGTAVGATAAAPVLIAVGVGAAVSWGTGWVIEHHGDAIADAAGDLGGGVKDAAESAWDWAFG